MKMAKLGAVIDQWMKATEVTISAVQCWTSIEENLGVVPCTVMSMMSDELLSSACEVDVCGVLSMHALRLASETPSALLDWNNNYGDNPDKAVCFHCSNLPKHFFNSMKMDYQAIIAGTVGIDNTFGTVRGQSESRADELCAILHRRPARSDSRVRRRRAIHRRSAGNIRRSGRGGDSTDAKAAALHLRKRIRASRRREFVEHRRGGLRSRHALPRLADVLAPGLALYWKWQWSLLALNKTAVCGYLRGSFP